jgi:hypothetical protein
MTMPLPALLCSGALIGLLALAPLMDPRAHREVTGWCAAVWFAACLIPVLYR